MQTRSLITRAATALLSAAFVFSADMPKVHAQGTSSSVSFSAQSDEATPINVLVGQSRIINFDRPIGRFSVSNPEVAEAVLVAPDQVLVNGKNFGQVNFIAWAKDGGQFHVFDVFVRANLSLIDSQIRALFPKDDIRLSQANGSVVMSGNVAEMKTAKRAEEVVQAAGFKTVNMLETPTKGVAQVMLQVRIAEVSKSKMRELGTSYGFANGATSSYLNSGSGPTSLKTFSQDSNSSLIETAVSPALNIFLGNGVSGLAGMLRALKSTGALRSLAEPNIIAMDGQKASFLAGGEFPVPIVTPTERGQAIAIIFKEYGVRLNFTPTIIDENHIRLEMEPEVSTIDYANGVKFDGYVIPGLRTRRAKTGVELRDGQSFALAGLLDNSEIQSFSKIPVVGDIPFFGNLFKSKSFEKRETELMFFVTAQLVKPVNPDDLPATRGLDGIKTGSPLGVEPKGEGITGASGFSTGAANSSAPVVEASKPAAEVAPANTTNEKSSSDKSKTRAIGALPANTGGAGDVHHLPASTLDAISAANKVQAMLRVEEMVAP